MRHTFEKEFQPLLNTIFDGLAILFMGGLKSCSIFGIP
jgi:hypothetical protein